MHDFRVDTRTQAVWLQVSSHPNRVSHSSSNSKQGRTSTGSLHLSTMASFSLESSLPPLPSPSTDGLATLLRGFVSSTHSSQRVAIIRGRAYVNPAEIGSLFYYFVAYRMQSWLSIFMGSASTDLTSHRLKTPSCFWANGHILSFPTPLSAKHWHCVMCCKWSRGDLKCKGGCT